MDDPKYNCLPYYPVLKSTPRDLAAMFLIQVFLQAVHGALTELQRKVLCSAQLLWAPGCHLVASKLLSLGCGPDSGCTAFYIAGEEPSKLIRAPGAHSYSRAVPTWVGYSAGPLACAVSEQVRTEWGTPWPAPQSFLFQRTRSVQFLLLLPSFHMIIRLED